MQEQAPFLYRVIGLLQIRNVTITRKKDYRTIIQDLNRVLKDGDKALPERI